jgi:nucleoside-diphosphate-sugar epimerase
MTGVDGVFHCAAWYKVGAPDASMAERINIGGTRNVLETMRDLRIPKGVYTSTLAVFSDTGGREVDEGYYHAGPFLSEYDRTKWKAHYEVALPLIREGLPLVIAQPGVIYGPGDTRGRAGEPYIVCGPSHTMTEAFQMAREITGVAPPSFHPSPGLMKASSALMGVVGAVVRLPSELTAEGLRVLAGVTYLGSNAKAKRELGYAPRPLMEGLRPTLAHEMRGLGMTPSR